MKTTKLGSFIVAECERLLKEKVAETDGENRSAGIKVLADEFNRIPTKQAGFTYGGAAGAWCAVTVSVILERAFKLFDGSSTPIASANAANLANLAKLKGIRVDNNPAIGAIALTKAGSKSGRHAQMVWNYEDLGDGKYNILTCEGNGEANVAYWISANDCLTKVTNKHSLHSRLKKNYGANAATFTDFIHIEEYGGGAIQEFASSNAFQSTFGLADGASCPYTVIEEDEDGVESDGGSEGVPPVPVQDVKSFWAENKTELLLLGGGAFLFLIGCFIMKK